MINTYVLTILLLAVNVIIIITMDTGENFLLDPITGFKMSGKLTDSDLSDWKEAQRKMTYMLREFVRICTKHNINKWWACGGTLIGAVRHQGWIPWDGDIDVSMMEEDYTKFKKIVQAELPDSMWFQSRETDKNYTSISGMSKIRDLHSCYPKSGEQSHSGLQIDIFIYKREGDSVVPVFLRNDDIKKYPANLMLPAGTRLFEGIKVNVPKNVDAYCKDNFGSAIPELPQISSRIPHEGEGHVDPFNTCNFHHAMYPEKI